MGYDVVVIGLGSVGSAAAAHLAGRGASVCGLERFAFGHEQGSAAGETRVIRLAYFEHPAYVPLLRRAYDLWADLERASGRRLYHEVGALQVGAPGGRMIQGLRAASAEHGLALEALSPGEIAERFPGFAVEEGLMGLLEQRAGYLDVAPCVLAHVEMAQKAGATLRSGVAVEGWRAIDGGFAVRADGEEITGKKLVIAGGAWNAELLSDLGLPLQVLRKALLWFGAPAGAYDESSGSPVFLHDLPGGMFYGFPQVPGSGEVKVAEHTGGLPVPHPAQVERGLLPEDAPRVQEFVSRFLPYAHSDELLRYKVCMYTMTPDGNFVVGRHPRHPGLSFVAGLSGHGFKFSSVLGEILADLALEGRTEHPVDLFDPGRF